MSVFCGIFTLIVGAMISSAGAADILDVRGFGTAAVEKSDSQFDSSDRDSHNDQFNFAKDSRVGLNFSAKKEEWQVATQLSARGGTGKFLATLDFAQAAYKAPFGLRLRLGRIFNPVWLVSDQIDVGYSYMWIRPPEAVYSLNPVKSLDGGSLSYLRELWGQDFELELVAGGNSINLESSSYTFNPRYYGSLDNAIGINFSVGNADTYRVRAGYIQGNAQFFTEAPISLSSVSNSLSSVYALSKTQMDTGRAQFFSLGARAQFGSLILWSEWAKRFIAGTAVTRAAAGYETVGYELGRWLPHFTHSWQGELQGSAFVHPGYSPNTATGLSYAGVTAQSTTGWILGVNYKAAENFTAKLEVEKSFYNYSDPSKDFAVWAYRLALDFLM